MNDESLEIHPEDVMTGRAIPSGTIRDLRGQLDEGFRESSSEWIFSPEELLSRLDRESTDYNDRITAILFAETTAFPKAMTARLLSALFDFIDQNRFRADEESTTAVASAVRKYAMCMDESRFEEFATWLLPSQTEVLVPELELEFAKAMAWRLMYVPFDTMRHFPKVIQILCELANEYLSPRGILQRNHASTVLHCIVAVAILGAAAGEATHATILFEKALSLQMPWFTELLNDRVDEAVSNLAEHHARLSESLRELRVISR